MIDEGGHHVPERKTTNKSIPGYELRTQGYQIRTATGGRHAETPAEYYQSAESAQHTNCLQVLVRVRCWRYLEHYIYYELYNAMELYLFARTTIDSEPTSNTRTSTRRIRRRWYSAVLLLLYSYVCTRTPFCMIPGKSYEYRTATSISRLREGYSAMPGIRVPCWYSCTAWLHSLLYATYQVSALPCSTHWLVHWKSSTGRDCYAISAKEPNTSTSSQKRPASPCQDSIHGQSVRTEVQERGATA